MKYRTLQLLRKEHQGHNFEDADYASLVDEMESLGIAGEEFHNAIRGTLKAMEMDTYNFLKEAHIETIEKALDYLEGLLKQEAGI